MPRYHFHVDNGAGYIPDEEGRDLPDLDSARAEALKGARSIIAEDVLTGRIDLAGRLEIADEAGRILCTILFSEAVAVRLPDMPGS